MKQLSMIDRAFFLKKTPLFSSLDVDLLLTIADKLESEIYKKGTKIFEIDQEAGRLYMLVEGSVLIKNRQQTPLAELRPPEVFGDEALLAGKKRGYDAYCETDVLLLTLSHSHLTALLEECPPISLYLLEAYASNIDFRKR